MLGNCDMNELIVFVLVFLDIDDIVYSGKKKISYKVCDGLIIEGYLILFVGYKKGDKLFIIVFLYGGLMVWDYVDFDYWIVLFVYNGYVVL